MKIKTIYFTIAALLFSSFGTASNLQKAQSKNVISNYAKMQSPLVFAHGMMGFNRIAMDVLGMDYWHQILPDLARNGSTAFAARMSPFNSSEVRGEQYVEQLKEVWQLRAPKNSI